MQVQVLSRRFRLAIVSPERDQTIVNDILTGKHLSWEFRVAALADRKPPSRMFATIAIFPLKSIRSAWTHVSRKEGEVVKQSRVKG